MPEAYRIVKAKYAGGAFDGEGARMQGGRWSSIGNRIVYTAGSLSLAVLEILVHLQNTEALSAYVVIRVEFPDNLVDGLDPVLLPANWRVSPAPAGTMKIGDDWIRESRSTILRVPSVTVPSEHNFLINPAHQDFSSITIGNPTPLDVDPRVFRKATGT
jgi:RES domain-containing protein